MRKERNIKNMNARDVKKILKNTNNYHEHG